MCNFVSVQTSLKSNKEKLTFPFFSFQSAALDSESEITLKQNTKIISNSFVFKHSDLSGVVLLDTQTLIFASSCYATDDDVACPSCIMLFDIPYKE